MRKALPDKMFINAEQSRTSMLRDWVLANKVTEIEMTEVQFWNLVLLQPPSEKPWTTFMGRQILVPDMPEGPQRNLGLFDKRSPGAI